jgi:IclR family acetate operon transcriptional repressor
VAPLERAFDVLEYVADRGEVRVGEICQDLKLPRPTVHRLLTVLIDRGYLDHDPVRHVYRTGPTTTRIAAHTKASRVVQFGEPALVAMREASGETANLGIVRGGRIVYAATLDGFRFPRMSVTIGEDVPPHAAAIGKALLADLGEQERTRLLGPEPYPSYTERTITTRAALDAELARILERGFAIDCEEIDADAVCIAAAIHGEDGKPVAGLSVSATSSRLPPAALEQLSELVIKWCKHVSSVLAAGA